MFAYRGTRELPQTAAQGPDVGDFGVFPASSEKGMTADSALTILHSVYIAEETRRDKT